MISYRGLWRKLKEEGICKSGLIKMAELSPGTVKRLKRNETVSLYSLEKICRILDCDIGEIMEYVGD